jgi:hypothetical protein
MTLLPNNDVSFWGSKPLEPPPPTHPLWRVRVDVVAAGLLCLRASTVTCMCVGCVQVLLVGGTKFGIRQSVCELYAGCPCTHRAAVACPAPRPSAPHPAQRTLPTSNMLNPHSTLGPMHMDHPSLHVEPARAAPPTTHHRQHVIQHLALAHHSNHNTTTTPGAVSLSHWTHTPRRRGPAGPVFVTPSHQPLVFICNPPSSNCGFCAVGPGSVPCLLPCVCVCVCVCVLVRR